MVHASQEELDPRRATAGNARNSAARDMISASIAASYPPWLSAFA